MTTANTSEEVTDQAQEAEQQRQSEQAFDDIARQLALFPELEPTTRQAKTQDKS